MFLNALWLKKCVIRQLIDVFYKTQEIWSRVVSGDSFLIAYCPDNYKIQRICNEAVDDSLAALKLIPDWFVTSKMIEKLYTALYADECIL